MKLLGTSLLITGAAGRVGSATARLALAEGAQIILSDISEKKLEELKIELDSLGYGKVHSIKSDVTTEDGIGKLLVTAQRFSEHRISAVHCAYPRSAGWGESFEQSKFEYICNDLSMQLGGAILFSQKIINLFREQGGGNLIHISSIQGIRAPKFDHYKGTSMTSPIEYAAIKSGIISITRWLAKYCANQNIRVNCVSPGGIRDNPPVQPDAFLARYRESCTNIGMLDPDLVASAIVFLLSPSSLAINGQNLIVDDGWSL